MNIRDLLAGTAIATTLVMAGALPAAANATIDLGGYSGPVQLDFDNYESFLTPGNTVATGPAVGDYNFGIFSVTSISVPGLSGKTLWSSAVNNPGNDVLVGVFNNIKVATVTSFGAFGEGTTNTGGAFELFEVPANEFKGDLGLAGYSVCSGYNTLCYNGITNTAQGQPVLTLTLTPNPVSTLTAFIQGTATPPTGSASFAATITFDSQFGPLANGKDSFCPNNSSICPGHDGTSFALASQDPIIATAIATPEPGSMAVLGSALLSLGFLGSRRLKKKDPRP